jgi:hypothetical protein
VPVAHACNPRNSEGRDQENLDSRPAQGNSWRDPISKKPIMKEGQWSGSREHHPSKCKALSSNPSVAKKKKKKILMNKWRNL